ncbi:MAG: nuclear transport factor 2 family protein [Actinomycetota bacterium]
MTEHPNVELLRRAEEAFSSGDLAALAGLLADDIVVHAPGRSPLAGEYRGRDAVFAYNARIFELSGGTYENEVHDILAGDEHGVILQRNRATRPGRELDVREVLVMHVRDGRILEVWEMYDDLAAYDRFWS